MAAISRRNTVRPPKNHGRKGSGLAATATAFGTFLILGRGTNDPCSSICRAICSCIRGGNRQMSSPVSLLPLLLATGDMVLYCGRNLNEIGGERVLYVHL